MFYGSHLSCVIINPLFQEDEAKAMGPALERKLCHDCLISDHYHNSDRSIKMELNWCFAFESPSQRWPAGTLHC